MKAYASEAASTSGQRSASLSLSPSACGAARHQRPRPREQLVQVHAVDLAGEARAGEDLRADRLHERPQRERVVRVDEMDGHAHERGPHRPPLLERGRQHARVKALQPGPQRHVRSQRRLGLQADEVVERVGGRAVHPAEQPLALEQRAVERPRRERGHACCQRPAISCQVGGGAGARSARACAGRRGRARGALADGPRALGVAQVQRGDLLEHEADVVDVEVGAQGARLAGALEQAAVELLGAVGGGDRAPGGGEGAGEVEGQRGRVVVDALRMKLSERLPRVARVGQGRLDGGDVAVQAVGAQGAEQVLLARVAAVEGAVPDPGALGHLGDRRLRVGDEHLARGFEDAVVVAGGLARRPLSGACAFVSTIRRS